MKTVIIPKVLTDTKVNRVLVELAEASNEQQQHIERLERETKSLKAQVKRLLREGRDW